MDGLAIFVSIVGVVGTVTGSILGARLGGRYVKESVLISADKSREAERERERQEITNLRKALLVEIDTLMIRYMDGMGNLLECHPSDEPLIIIYPAYQRYFVIFEENAHLIGKIPDDKERALIVSTYNSAKGLLDSYTLNNSMTEKHNYAVGLGPAVLGQNFKPVAAEIHRMMKNYVPVLKQIHAETIALYKDLRASLHQEIDWG